MGLVVLLLFILVPLIEIAVFIELGGLLGLWPTLGLIVLTAALGTWQLRSQGLSTLARARQAMEQGQIPAHELFDGLCLLVAGALLLTPGFVTDAFGFVLFVPALRTLLRQFLGRYVKLRAQAEVHMRTGPKGRSSTIIEGDFQEVPDDPDRLPPRGGSSG